MPCGIYKISSVQYHLKLLIYSIDNNLRIDMNNKRKTTDTKTMKNGKSKRIATQSKNSKDMKMEKREINTYNGEVTNILISDPESCKLLI